MTKLQFLLLKLAEEAGEIVQIAAKTSQFGMLEKYPEQPFTNAERCHQEINDLLAIIDMLNDEFNFGFVGDVYAMEMKKKKASKYLSYSVRLGMVDPK